MGLLRYRLLARTLPSGLAAAIQPNFAVNAAAIVQATRARTSSRRLCEDRAGEARCAKGMK